MTGIEVTVDPASLRKLEEIRARGVDVRVHPDALRVASPSHPGRWLLGLGLVGAGAYVVMRAKKGRG